MNKLLKIILGFYRKILGLAFPAPCDALFILRKMSKQASINKDIVNGIELYYFYEYKNKSVAQTIWSYKKYGFFEFVDHFADLIYEFLLEFDTELNQWERKNILLTCVPLHKSRMRKRGFDQNKLILSKLKEYNLPENTKIDADILTRTKNTKEQKHLSKSERKENMKGAFALQKDIDGETDIIVIFDDIFTSGATLFSAKAAVRQKFKGRIVFLSIAKV